MALYRRGINHPKNKVAGGTVWVVHTVFLITVLHRGRNRLHLTSPYAEQNIKLIQ